MVEQLLLCLQPCSHRLAHPRHNQPLGLKPARSSLPDCSSAIHNSPANFSFFFAYPTHNFSLPLLVTKVLFILSFFLEVEGFPCKPFFLKDKDFVVVAFFIQEEYVVLFFFKFLQFFFLLLLGPK